MLCKHLIYNSNVNQALLASTTHQLIVEAYPLPLVQIMNASTLTPTMLHAMDADWRAANYLSVGQIYLADNPLLKGPLTLADVKPMLLGHWGTTPGQNFIYTHLNRVIEKIRPRYDLRLRPRARRPGGCGPHLP